MRRRWQRCSSASATRTSPARPTSPAGTGSSEARRDVIEERSPRCEPGKLAILPTDTVYGLASSPDEEPVRRLYRAEGPRGAAADCAPRRRASTGCSSSCPSSGRARFASAAAGPVHARAPEPRAPLPLAERREPGDDRCPRARARGRCARGARAGSARSPRRARTSRAAPIRAGSPTSPRSCAPPRPRSSTAASCPASPSTVLDLSGAEPRVLREGAVAGGRRARARRRARAPRRSAGRE